MAGVAFAILLLWSLSNAIPHPESYLLITMTLQDRCFCANHTLKNQCDDLAMSNKYNNSAQLFIVRMHASAGNIINFYSEYNPCHTTYKPVDLAVTTKLSIMLLLQIMEVKGQNANEECTRLTDYTRKTPIGVTHARAAKRERRQFVSAAVALLY